MERTRCSWRTVEPGVGKRETGIRGSKGKRHDPVGKWKIGSRESVIRLDWEGRERRMEGREGERNAR